MLLLAAAAAADRNGRKEKCCLSFSIHQSNIIHYKIKDSNRLKIHPHVEDAIEDAIEDAMKME